MGEKLKIVADVLGGYDRRGDEYLFHCPFCNHHKKKLSLNFNKNVAKCWTCDWRAKNIYRIVRSYGSYGQRQRWLELDGRLDLQDFDKIYNEINEIEEEPTCELPEEMISLCNKRLSYSSKKPLNYLHSRGIDDDQIKLWKIGYCVEGRYSGRIIIPSFNLNGDPNFFIARSFVGHRMKYLNPRTTKDIIFNELMVDWDEPVVIVEGAFDALVAGSQAIPVLGSTLRPQSRLFQALAMNDTPVYIGLDADAEKKASWMIKKMIEYDMEVYRIDTSAVEDIGSMTPRQFENAKDRAQPIDPDYFFFDELLNAI